MTSDSGTLLVVDDNEANLDMLSRRLQRKGYTTLTAGGGQEALECIREQTFDLILLDIMMPDIDGIDVLRTLRQTYSAAELPVIMVTAKSDSEQMVEALDLGANDYVTKPIDINVVLARIRTQLARKQADVALRQNEERQALALNGANDGIWDWNLPTNEFYFSPAWQALLGLPEHEITSKPDTWLSRVHPDDRPLLQTDLNAHARNDTPKLENEHRIKHADGTYHWVLCRGRVVRDCDGQAYRMVGSLSDITERKIADGLTGLPNRLLFLEHLERAIEHVWAHPSYRFAVIFLGLDRFKLLNDSLGHVIGDQMLVDASQRLGLCLRSGDTFSRLDTEPTLARIEGDGFAILLDNLNHDDDAVRVTKRLQSALVEPFIANEQEVFLTASAGIAHVSSESEQQSVRSETILRNAEIAMQRAKANGPAGYMVFDSDMQIRALERWQLEADLRRGIEARELCVFYQPIVALAAGRIAGFEALVRWRHPEHGIVSPNAFIPVAEESGLIIPIGSWVLRESCRQMYAWQTTFPTYPPLFMSVNLSVKQLQDPDFGRHIDQLLQDIGIPPSSLKLEITESLLMEHTELVTPLINKIRDLGIQVSLDDFGTGYSSLSHLHSFPINTLKIDCSFVARMESQSESSEIVRTILALAQHLNMDVVAEGIESEHQLQKLRAFRCEYGQGFLFAKPLEKEAAETLLAEDHQWE